MDFCDWLRLRSFDRLAEARPADAFGVLGPPDHRRLTLDEIDAHGAPLARIVAVVAVVAHHKHRARGDDRAAQMRDGCCSLGCCCSAACSWASSFVGAYGFGGSSAVTAATAPLRTTVEVAGPCRARA